MLLCVHQCATWPRVGLDPSDNPMLPRCTLHCGCNPDFCYGGHTLNYSPGQATKRSRCKQRTAFKKLSKQANRASVDGRCYPVPTCHEPLHALLVSILSSWTANTAISPMLICSEYDQWQHFSTAVTNTHCDLLLVVTAWPQSLLAVSLQSYA